MQQLALTLEPGLAQRHRDLRECFATCVYARGLGRVAALVDLSPSNLSEMLSGTRNLPTDVVERYMAETKDTTPALYLAARWLQDATTIREQALAAIPGLVSQLTSLLAQAKA